MKKTLTLLSTLLCFSAFADNVNMAGSNPTGNTMNSQPAMVNPPGAMVSGVTADSSGPETAGAYTDVQLGSANSSGLNSGADNAMAGRLDLGYKINPYFGFEGGLTGVNQPTAGTVLSSLQIIDASITGFMPLGDYLDVHGQLGLAYADVGATTVQRPDGDMRPGLTPDSGFKGLIGVGFDIYLTKSFALTANDYNYLGSSTTVAGGGNTNIVMGGFKYNFR